MKFTELLIKYRERADINKTDLAKKVGKSAAYLMNIEAGRTKKPPTLDLVEKLSSALNLNTKEQSEFMRTAALERLPKKERAILDNYRLESSASHAKISPDIIEALQDPVAVKALIMTHKNSEDIKKSIKHMLECFPILSPDKRQAILALCK